MAMLTIRDDQGVFLRADTNDFDNERDAAVSLVEQLMEWFEGTTVYSEEIINTEISILSELITSIRSGFVDVLDADECWLDSQGFIGESAD